MLEILEVVPNKRLKSTHNAQVVTYDLTEDGGATTLKVTQENNPSYEMVAESEKTWAMMLDGLKSVVES